jgi:serine/threonine-protein kinase HipA
MAQGKISQQFANLAEHAGLSKKQFSDIFDFMISDLNKVENLVAASFLNESTKRNYWQSYLTRKNKLMRP